MKKWTKGSKGCVRFAGCGGFWVLGVRARWRKEDSERTEKTSRYWISNMVGRKKNDIVLAC